MTRRGLVIGNSHAAALRLAQQAFAADWSGMRLDFAAMHGSAADFCVRAGTLSARDAKGRKRLFRISGRSDFTLADYDFVAVCGSTPSNFGAIRLYLEARWIGLPSFQLAEPLGGKNWLLLSEGCFEAALTGIMRAAAAFPLLDALAAAGCRCFMVPTPLLSAEALTLSKEKHLGFVMMNGNGDAEALSAMMDRALLRACGGQSTALIWPDSVRVNGFFARPEFRRGAKRLGTTDTEAQPEEDFFHANADYGHKVLSELYRQLGLAPSGRAIP